MSPESFSISLADVGNCPLRSLLASHYRPDGSCLCFPEFEPEIPADPTGVDCAERYEGIEP